MNQKKRGPVQSTRDGKWRWRVGVYLAWDPLTRRQTMKWSPTFKADTPAECEQKVADWKVDVEKGIPDASTETLAVWGRSWLDEQRDDRVGRDLKRSTWTSYDSAFRTCIEAPTDPKMPRLGSRRMKDLTPKDVRRLYRYLSTSPNRRRLINLGRAKTLHAVLRQIFTAAFNDDALSIDLVGKLRKVLPKQKRAKRPKAFTGEQLDAFLRAADDDPYRAFWYLFVTTGARPGELLALRWQGEDERDDVSTLDLQAHTIHIVQTLHRIPKVPKAQRWEFTEAKSEKADRVVEFPEELVPLLDAHRAQQQASRKERKEIGSYADLVFTTSSGTPMDWINMTKQYHRICRRAKLGTFAQPLTKPAGRPGPAKQPKFTPLLSPYHLRHTNATVMHDGDVPMEVIRDRLGHNERSTTDKYIGKRTGGQKAAVAVWSKRLRKVGS